MICYKEWITAFIAQQTPDSRILFCIRSNSNWNDILESVSNRCFPSSYHFAWNRFPRCRMKLRDGLYLAQRELQVIFRLWSEKRGNSDNWLESCVLLMHSDPLAYIRCRRNVVTSLSSSDFIRLLFLLSGYVKLELICHEVDWNVSLGSSVFCRRSDIKRGRSVNTSFLSHVI